MGTSVWFDVLRKSSLNDFFQIHWFNVNVHSDFTTLGKRNFRKLWPNIRLYFDFIRVINNYKPELVLVPISQSTIGFLKDSIFIRIARNKSKTLIMLHGSKLLIWLNNSSYIINRYFSGTLDKTRGAIVLGNKLKHLFISWYPEENIFVVPNGLSFNNMPVSDKTGTTIKIRFIGSLSKAKGIVEIVEATKILKKSHKDFQLILNGVWRDTQLKNECEKIITKNTLPVKYEGEVTGVAKYSAYSDSDIFVFTPNKPEGHPLVIIEAMAAGLPVISTDQGAITESVINGVNGFIVKTNSPGEIAEKISFLIDNPEIRIRLGKVSRRLYEENFTEEKMVERLIYVFNKVLDEK